MQDWDETGQAKHGSDGRPRPGHMGPCMCPRGVLYQQKRHGLVPWGAASLGEGFRKMKWLERLRLRSRVRIWPGDILYNHATFL